MRGEFACSFPLNIAAWSSVLQFSIIVLLKKMHSQSQTLSSWACVFLVSMETLSCRASTCEAPLYSGKGKREYCGKVIIHTNLICISKHDPWNRTDNVCSLNVSQQLIKFNFKQMAWFTILVMKEVLSCFKMLWLNKKIDHMKLNVVK